MEMPGIPEGYIAGISFGYDLKRADYFTDAPLRSLELLKKQTGAIRSFSPFMLCRTIRSLRRSIILAGIRRQRKGLRDWCIKRASCACTLY